ncbi:MAG: hypothetical protein AAFO91_04645, partial [Bacteroidota bacterium]
TRTKGAVCTSVKALALVEDHFTTAESVAQYGLPVLMPTRPWNRAHEPLHATRVTDWTEILEQLRDLSEAA